MLAITDFLIKQRERNSFWLGMICIVGCTTMLAFPLLGIQNGYDISQHIRFAGAYQEAILNGSFIPGWADSDNLGFGSVGIRFYPPLADFLLAVTQIFTNDWYRSMEINSIFWMFPGCIGVYLWVKEFGSRTEAGFAGMLYAVMPYHVLQIYDFSLYSEFAASAILPFCFLFATKLVKSENRWDIVGLGVSSSLLILTHLPSSLVGLSGLGVYSVLMIDWRSPAKQVLKLAFAGLLAVACSAFYLVRLITEINFVKHNSAEFSTGFYDHERHFFPLINHFGETYWLEYIWVIDVVIVLTSALILPSLITVVIVCASKAPGNTRKTVFISLVGAGTFSLFMLSSWSGFAWNHLPFLEKIQFPWRFLSLTSLIASVSVVLIPAFVTTHFKHFRKPIAYLLTAIVVCILFYDFTQTIIMAPHLSRDEFYTTVVNKPADDFCTCWWPTWAGKNAFSDTNKVSAVGRSVDIQNWGPTAKDFTVGPGSSTDVRVATFFYPYWKASLNGSQAAVKMDSDGVVLIPISSETVNVHLHFEEPQIELVSLYITLFSWITIGSVFAVSCFRRNFTSPQE